MQAMKDQVWNGYGNYFEKFYHSISQSNQGSMLNMKIFNTSEDFFVSCRYGLKERDTFTRRNPFKNSKNWWKRNRWNSKILV